MRDGEGPLELASHVELRLLAETVAELGGRLDLNELMARVARRITALVDCDLFCLMLWNERRQMLEHSFSLCDGVHYDLQDGQGFPLGFGVSGAAAASLEAIRIDEVSEDARYVRCRHPEVEVRSELAVPLVFRGRLVGVLDLESRRAGAFRDAQVRLVSTLATAVASALENARLHQDVVTREARHQSDLATARQMQRVLLPEMPQRTDGLVAGAAWTPARALGGDFFDVLPFAPGRVAFAIGDVAGKATSAALYASLAVGMLRGHVVERARAPREMLSHLNEHLASLALNGRFLGLVFGYHDADAGELLLANAGMPRPLLCRDGAVTALEVAGLPLALFHGVQHEEQRLAVRPGDRVVFYSDGLVDNLSRTDVPFGTERLLAACVEHAGRGAQEMAEALLGACLAHSARAREREDDCTVLVLELPALEG